jgi:hypothetical protein
MNLQIAQVYLHHSDPTLASRTWADVMERVCSTKTGNTKERYEMAIKDSAFDSIRDRKLLETTSDHFLRALQAGTVSTNVYLRRFHNYAIGMHWLPWPVLLRLHWPSWARLSISAPIPRRRLKMAATVSPRILGSSTNGQPSASYFRKSSFGSGKVEWLGAHSRLCHWRISPCTSAMISCCS